MYILCVYMYVFDGGTPKEARKWAWDALEVQTVVSHVVWVLGIHLCSSKAQQQHLDLRTISAALQTVPVPLLTALSKKNSRV